MLRPDPLSVFAPVALPGKQQGAELVKCGKPWQAADPDLTVADGKIEITLPDGTSIRIGHDVSLVALPRVVTVLRG
jgi:hypothetical protein